MKFLKNLFKKKEKLDIQIEEIKRFKALETFTVIVDKVSHKYVEGGVYNIREDNPALAERVEQFIEKGMAEMSNSVSKVTGRGIVK